MRFGRYCLILISIAACEMFFNLSNHYMRAKPEILYTIAFIVALHVASKYIVPVFFIAGVVCDLFTGEDLGVSAFLYIVAGAVLLYILGAVQEKNWILRFLFLVLSLFCILVIKSLLLRFALPQVDLILILSNNLLLSLLLTPAIGVILALPLVCPWKAVKYS